MANRYVVDTNNIFVYTGKNQINSNRCGILTKGTEFIGKPVVLNVSHTHITDEHWREITQCSGHPEFVGKYVYYTILSSGENIKTLATGIDESSETDPEPSNPEGTGLIGVNGAPIYNTEAQTSSINTPVSRTYTGDTVESVEEPVTYIEDEFLQEYNSAISADEYKQQLSEGLMVRNLRGILGIPHQFIPTTDCRTDPDDPLNLDKLGRVYSEKILKAMPILLLTPGTPSFMSQFSNAQKTNILTSLLANVSDSFKSQLVNSYSGKYYTLKFAYVEYFKYVNAMLRSAALFLGIGDVRVDNKRLDQFNWLYDNSGDNSQSWQDSAVGKFLGPYSGCIAFYADCGTQVQDSFTNQTTQSQLASSLNNLSDTGRELNFLVGNVGSLAGIKVNALTGEEGLEQNMANIQDVVNSVLGSGNIMSNILNKAQTILAGGRLIFPEIWSDSSFGRSYSCSMKLVARSGDNLSVFFDELVPISHLLGMCWPRQSIQQSYFSPFLIRGYYKGQFNIDMAIMTDLSITKGAEGEFTVNGLPTVMEVNFTLKDLYDGIMMSKADSEHDTNIMSNVTELDYIANSCGLNINDQEILRTIKLWKVLNWDSTITDTIRLNIFGNITQFFNQQLNNLFGYF